MKSFVRTVFISVFLLLLTAGFSFAAEPEINYKSYKELSPGSSVSVESDLPMRGLYLVFWEEPGEWTLEGESASVVCGKNGFIQEYIDFTELFGESLSSATLSFPDGAKLCGSYPVTREELPPWVHVWKPPCEEADILLFSAHADDEQLFFAGILPYYSKVAGLEVQVAYLTDHFSDIRRHHERLNGLWAVGIENYPVSLHVSDAWSESCEEALFALAGTGFDESSLIEEEKALIERFKPKVIISHDEKGEYGHGQHMLLAETLKRAVSEIVSEGLPDDSACPERLFLHLYEENPLTLSFLDIPYEELGGKTPFQVAQDGFSHHKSQHWTWFNDWIYGSGGSLKYASEIKKYSPLYYGLAYSREDSAAALESGDFFAGLASHAQDREEAERIERERILAEEQRIAEEAEKERIAAEEAAAVAKRKAENRILIVSLSAAFIGVAVLVLLRKGRKKP